MKIICPSWRGHFQLKVVGACHEDMRYNSPNDPAMIGMYASSEPETSTE